MYQICVSGAAKGDSVEEGRELARQLGAAIAKAGHSLMTGATIGLPNYAAEGYKKAGGKMSVGISPASSKVEHVMKYRLPIKAYDTIIYSGLHYVGRDTLLITSSDAVVSIGTPIGFLQGAGGISNEIEHLMEVAQPLRDEAFVTFNEDAEKLINELTRHLDKEHAKYKHIYQ
jgi:uncharacterized protein (TIGR00725 family)